MLLWKINLTWYHSDMVFAVCDMVFAVCAEEPKYKRFSITVTLGSTEAGSTCLYKKILASNGFHQRKWRHNYGVKSSNRQGKGYHSEYIFCAKLLVFHAKRKVYLNMSACVLRVIVRLSRSAWNIWHDEWVARNCDVCEPLTSPEVRWRSQVLHVCLRSCQERATSISFQELSNLVQRKAYQRSA